MRPSLFVAFLVVAFCGAVVVPARGAAVPETPELALVLLSPETMVSANFPDAEQFSSWLNPVLDACRQALAAEKRRPALVVQITLRKQADPVFELAGHPSVPASLRKRLRAAFDAMPPLRPPVSDLALRVQTPGRTNDPIKEAATFKPRLYTPDEVADAAFAKADLAGKLALLRAWTREQGLPLLAHAAAQVDERFVGVRQTGQQILGIDWTATVPVDEVLYASPDFWRGIVEMAPGNQLIGALPALAFAANGEIDRAASLSGVLVQFSMEDTLARVVLLRLRQRIFAFRQELGDAINRGITLHDRKSYDRAIALYEKVLEAYPNSAWARYELFFSTYAKLGLVQEPGSAEREHPLWQEAAAEIYRMDPLYEVQFAGSRGTSMGSMFDRLTLRTMSREPVEDPGERFATLAEIALHLRAHGPAAQTYWALLSTQYNPRTRILPAQEATTLTSNDVLARFLYCVEKLGVTSLKENFQGDFPEEFAELDRELRAWRTQ